MKKNNNINLDKKLKILKSLLSLVAEGKIDVSGHDLILDDIKECYDWFLLKKNVSGHIH